MAGQKGRSGPPRNMNASKYGWRALWRRAMVRPEDAWVRRPMNEYVAGLLGDKPGASAAEASAIEIAATSKGCALLILNALKEHGVTQVVNGMLELSPAAKELKGFLSIELQALRTIGMERRARPVNTLAELLSQEKRTP